MDYNTDDLLEELEDLSLKYDSRKEAYIIAIDLNPKMMTYTNEQPPIFKALKAVNEFLKYKIISSDKDKFCILFYNTSSKNNILDIDSINIYYQLNFIDANLIKDFNEFSNDISKFYTKLSPNNSDIISTEKLFQMCSHVFLNLKKHDKKIFIFTCNDDVRSADERNLSIRKAQDMFENRIVIELFPLNPVQDNAVVRFDIGKFWHQIIQFDRNEVNEEIQDYYDRCNSLDDLLDIIKKKVNTKRSLGKLDMTLGEGVTFGVKSYLLCKETKRPLPIKVNALNNVPLKTKTTLVDEITEEVVPKEDYLYYIVAGGNKEKFFFNKSDMDNMKTVVPKGIKLLGFKPKEYLQEYLNVSPTYFLEPDDTAFKNSSKVFYAFIQALINKNSIAMVTFKRMPKSYMEYAYLIPQDEIKENNRIVQYAGLHLVTLPYSEEVRNPEEDAKIVHGSAEYTVGDNLYIATKNSIDSITNTNVSNSHFNRYGIQKFYSVLESLALGDSELQELSDDLDNWQLLKSNANIHKLTDLARLVKTEAKTKSAVATSSTKAKMTKDDVKSLVLSGEINRLLVKELKEVCKAIDISGEGKKQDLIDRIKSKFIY